MGAPKRLREMDKTPENGREPVILTSEEVDYICAYAWECGYETAWFGLDILKTLQYYIKGE